MQLPTKNFAQHCGIGKSLFCIYIDMMHVHIDYIKRFNVPEKQVKQNRKQVKFSIYARFVYFMLGLKVIRRLQPKC